MGRLFNMAVLVLFVALLWAACSTTQANAQILAEEGPVPFDVELSGPFIPGQKASFKVLVRNETDVVQDADMDVFVIGSAQQDIYHRVLDVPAQSVAKTSDVVFTPEVYGVYVIIVQLDDSHRLFYLRDVYSHGIFLPVSFVGGVSLTPHVSPLTKPNPVGPEPGPTIPCAISRCPIFLPLVVNN